MSDSSLEKELPGLTLAESGIADTLKRITGPLPGIAGLQSSKEEGTVAKVCLPDGFSQKGSLSFWVRLDRTYASGVDEIEFTQPLISAESICEISFIAKPALIQFLTEWSEAEERDMPTRYFGEFPGIPGPSWVHLAYRWDSEKGTFERFVNGSPWQLAAQSNPWKAHPGDGYLNIHFGRFALAGIAISNQHFTDEALNAQVGNLYLNSLDHLLGFKPRGQFDVEPLKGELVYSNPLAKAEDVAGWVGEGKALQVDHADDWMELSSQDFPFPDNHFVYWCPEDLPGDFIAEWDFQLMSEKGLCIIFFAALGIQGEDIFAPSLNPREAHFDQYTRGDINCFHISYYANARTTINMRKNNGFHLVDNGPAAIPFASESIHRVTLYKKGAIVRLMVDGQKCIEFFDDGQRYGSVLAGGKIGFRQMKPAHCRYRNLKVYSIR